MIRNVTRLDHSFVLGINCHCYPCQCFIIRSFVFGTFFSFRSRDVVVGRVVVVVFSIPPKQQQQTTNIK